MQASNVAWQLLTTGKALTVAGKVLSAILSTEQRLDAMQSGASKLAAHCILQTMIWLSHTMTASFWVRDIMCSYQLILLSASCHLILSGQCVRHATNDPNVLSTPFQDHSGVEYVWIK